MFTMKDGEIKGVLNDFDLASVGTLGKGRMPSNGTGTRLFMAIELLGVPPSPHYYRHDLESLMYVMLWHSSRFDNGVAAIPSPYEHWVQASDDDVLEAYKIRFVHSEKPHLTPHFEALSGWIHRLQILFRRGLQARRRAREDGVVGWDDETLGGVVTFDAFAQICSESLHELRETRTPDVVAASSTSRF